MCRNSADIWGVGVEIPSCCGAMRCRFRMVRETAELLVRRHRFDSGVGWKIEGGVRLEES